MKVGMLGTGDVGKALANAFIALGHDVMMGGREANNEKARAWVAGAGPKASQGTFGDAARFGDIVVLATLGDATVKAVEMAGAAHFTGKLVVDTTNPLDMSKGFPPILSVGRTDSLGEQVQRALPGAQVVKCFNTVGNAHMFQPRFEGGPPDMFICGDSESAKQQMGAILKDFGWGVVDIGGISGSRYLEAMCLTWVLYGVQSKSWNHAFKLLRK